VHRLDEAHPRLLPGLRRRYQNNPAVKPGFKADEPTAPATAIGAGYRALSSRADRLVNRPALPPVAPPVLYFLPCRRLQPAAFHSAFPRRDEAAKLRFVEPFFHTTTHFRAARKLTASPPVRQFRYYKVAALSADNAFDETMEKCICPGCGNEHEVADENPAPEITKNSDTAQKKTIYKIVLDVCRMYNSYCTDVEADRKGLARAITAALLKSSLNSL
jgi:hypothetical protein